MSYLAIARKWRPQRFEDLVGQGHVTRTLQNAIRLKRVHHAFLFTGARGVGKTSAARILAKTLQCEAGPAENPCNVCGACKEINTGSHPDVLEIDGASNNRVDDVRDLIEKVRYLPARGRYRIYIIDEVHMVTAAAFNALLKTLEEPPPHVIFIFATTDPQKILDTVLSRCQRFDFKMIPVRVIHEHLREICKEEAVRVTDGALMLVAREAGGSMRDAQSLLDQVLSFATDEVTETVVVETLGFIDRTLLHTLLEAVVEGNGETALTCLRTVQEVGYDARQFARELLEGLRHLMVTALLKDASRMVDLPQEERERLGTLARRTSPDAIQRRFDILASALDDIARAEAPHLMLEMVVLRLTRVRPYVPLEGLVDRLLSLEKRLAEGGASLAPPPSRSPAPTVSSFGPRPVSPPSPVAAAAPPPTPPQVPPPSSTPPPAPVPPPFFPGVLKDSAPSPPRSAPLPPPVAAVVPPAPPASPPPSPLLVCDAGRWKEFVEEVRRTDAMKGSILHEGGFSAVEGAQLVIAFVPGKWVMAQRQGLEKDEKLLERASRFFGTTVGFRFVKNEGTGGMDSPSLSPAEEGRRLAEARRQQMEERARRHPSVEVLRAVFPGAEITETTPLERGEKEST